MVSRKENEKNSRKRKRKSTILNAVEGLNVINDPKCNKVLNTIIFCPQSREDKGDREGIPHTHRIPQVISIELFLRHTDPKGD